MDNELNTNVTEGQGTETQTETAKTYTQEEVDALLQAEGDKRVTQALKKAEKKQAEKIAEAQKMAQMNEQQKYVYQLEQREKEVAEKEKQLALAEMKNETGKILSEKGLSLSLVDLVVNEDAEITNTNIKTLEKAFKDSVKAEVEKRLASKTPTKSLPTDMATITREQFSKLSYSEKLALKEEQPELWEQITNKIRGN